MVALSYLLWEDFLVTPASAPNREKLRTMFDEGKIDEIVGESALSNLTPLSRAALLTFVADFSEKSTIAACTNDSESRTSSTKLLAEVSKQREGNEVAEVFLACHWSNKISSHYVS